MDIVNNEFYIIRTLPGKENKFIDTAYKLIHKKEDHGVISLFSPESVKGYIFVETNDLNKVLTTFRTVPNNKGIIRKPVAFEELSKYFEKEGEQIIVNERDIVEIVSGPFKGDRAKVIRVVPGKDEIIIEPINMSVPIPITLNLDDIRVIKNLDEENKNEWFKIE